MLQALLPQPHGDVQGTRAVMAEDDGRPVRIEFLQARWDISHGDLGSARNGGDLHLPWLADIEQEGGRRLVALGGVGVNGDLRGQGIRHIDRIRVIRLFGDARLPLCSRPAEKTVVH